MEPLQDLKEYAMKLWNQKFGPEMPEVPRETFHGAGYSISVEKKALRDMPKGINEKTTTVHALARRPNGEIVERTFGPLSSNSWKKNEKALYPQINEWCQSINGNNPSLSYSKEKPKGKDKLKQKLPAGEKKPEEALSH